MSKFSRGWVSLTACLVLVFLAGCISPRRGPGSGGGGGTPNPSATGKLYVSNTNANSILRFDNAFTANGDVAPGVTISGASTTLNTPAYITLDTANDRLYVANLGASSVLIFDAVSTKQGNVAPTRTLSGGNTRFVSPTDVALDKTRDLLYVADDIDILVFSPASTVSGDIAPVRDITPGFPVAAVFVDAANNRLYAADATSSAIAVWDNASTVDTTTAPTRSIGGASTTLSHPSGIVIDASGRLAVDNSSPGHVAIFGSAASGNGNLTPTAQINSSAFSSPDELALDSTGTGTLYVIDAVAAKVLIFGNLSTANGTVTPTRTIGGASSTFSTPQGIALDTTR